MLIKTGLIDLGTRKKIETTSSMHLWEPTNWRVTSSRSCLQQSHRDTGNRHAVRIATGEKKLCDGSRSCRSVCFVFS